MKPKQYLAVFMAALLLAAAALMAGCAAKQAAPVRHSRAGKSYAIVKTQPGDSLQSLANRYLGDKDKAWVISSFNQVASVKPGDFLIIPRQPVNLGGLTEDGFQTVPVLTYTAFSETTSDSLTITGQNFDKQLALLKDKGFSVISLSQLYDFMEFADSIPVKSVVLTIDDIGQGTYDIAYPILKKHGFTATIFVCTDMVTGADKALDWDKLKKMQADGFDIQHRTKSLRNLTRRKKGETFEDFVIDVDREISVASLILNDHLGMTPEFIAYPYGATNEMVIALLKRNGFRGGLAMGGKTNPFYADPFRVKRIPVAGDAPLEDLEKSLEVFVKEDLR